MFAILFPVPRQRHRGSGMVGGGEVKEVKVKLVRRYGRRNVLCQPAFAFLPES